MLDEQQQLIDAGAAAAAVAGAGAPTASAAAAPVAEPSAATTVTTAGAAPHKRRRHGYARVACAVPATHGAGAHAAQGRSATRGMGDMARFALSASSSARFRRLLARALVRRERAWRRALTRRRASASAIAHHGRGGTP